MTLNQTLPSSRSRPVVGISACLQGESVRYDGTGKLQKDLLADLSPFVDWLGFCPEMVAGLGVPRPPVKLIATASGVRAQNEALGIDCTEALNEASRSFWQSQGQTLNGYIFKSRSPSCGLGSTPVVSDREDTLELSSGLFAREAQSRNANLPKVEETWLNSSERHLRFLTACYLHWQLASQETQSDLIVLCGSCLSATHDPPHLISMLLSEEENVELDNALRDYWRRQRE